MLKCRFISRVKSVVYFPARMSYFLFHYRLSCHVHCTSIVTIKSFSSRKNEQCFSIKIFKNATSFLYNLITVKNIREENRTSPFPPGALHDFKICRRIQNILARKHRVFFERKNISAFW